MKLPSRAALLAALKSQRGSILAIVVAVAATFGITIAVSDETAGPPPHKTSVTVTLGGPQPGKQVITAPSSAVNAAKAPAAEPSDDLKNEDPPGLTADELKARNEQLARFAALDRLPLHFPASAPSQRGCTTELVRNYSSRNGVKPRIFVLHYTVSPNRAGWGDVNAVVSLFNNVSYQASSNYVIDNEGHCAYIVREVDKAWAQAAANPFSISAEVVNTGHESTYAGRAGLAKLAEVVHDAAKRWDFPLQTGKVSGCRVVRPGIVDHHSLGACGGGHFDISPPYSVAAVIKAARAIGSTPAAPHNVTVWCRKLNWERGLVRTGKPHKPTAEQRQLARERKALIEKHGYTCLKSGPRKH